MRRKVISLLLKSNYQTRSDLFKLRKLARAALEVAEPQAGRADKALVELRRYLHELDFADMQLIKKILSDTGLDEPPSTPNDPTDV